MEDENSRLGASGIMQAMRDRHPADYLMKIDSFSFLLEMLENTEAKSYDSEIFKASGYQWKLSLYPNGVEGRNGEGYISLYLCIQKTNALPRGWEVRVECKFFVLDHLRDKYIIFGDADGKLRRFHELKKEWGFAKLLPRSVFGDTTQGYLIQDKCVFGVEILPNSYTMSGECLALPEELSSTTHTWTVTDYSTLSGEISSDVFTMGNCKWSILLYPKGTDGEEGKSLSLFLKLADLKITPKVYAEYVLCLKNQENVKDWRISDEMVFSASSPSWGWPTFLPLKDIEDASKGFLVQDALIIEVQITRIALVQSLP